MGGGCVRTPVLSWYEHGADLIYERHERADLYRYRQLKADDVLGSNAVDIRRDDMPMLSCSGSTPWAYTLLLFSSAINCFCRLYLYNKKFEIIYQYSS